MGPHRSTRAAASVLIAVFLTWGASACGGSSTSESDNASSSSSEPESSSPATSPSEPSEESEPSEPEETGEALDDEEYIDQLNAAQADFSSAASKLNLANPKSPREFQRNLRRLVVLLETLSADVQEIEPPAEVAAEHEKLITTMEDYRAALVENLNGLSGSAQEVKQAAKAIAKAGTAFSRDFGSAINQINTKLDG